MVCGDDAAYTITTNSCYTLADVTVDGAGQGPITSYTFNTTTDCAPPAGCTPIDKQPDPGQK